MVSTFLIVTCDRPIGTLSHVGINMQNSLRAISTVIIRTVLCAEMTSCGMESLSGEVMGDRV